jgi:hypothetical protein
MQTTQTFLLIGRKMTACPLQGGSSMVPWSHKCGTSSTGGRGGGGGAGPRDGGQREEKTYI